MGNQPLESNPKLSIERPKESEFDREEIDPENITSYYTLEALTQVKDYQQLNKIMNIVKETRPEDRMAFGSPQRDSQVITSSHG